DERSRDIDITLDLLIFERDSNGKIIDVLNDFDLMSTDDGPSTGAECTGTVPFMALDLLTEGGLYGQLKHSYEYDAESFVWVLTW
ncbi:hypothetical protein EDC04DRAFT_2525241, partial [Pisolithus marmoratus]